MCVVLSVAPPKRGEKKKSLFLVVAPLVRESPCDTIKGVYIRTRVYVGGRQTNADLSKPALQESGMKDKILKNVCN